MTKAATIVRQCEAANKICDEQNISILLLSFKEGRSTSATSSTLVFK